MHFILAFDGEAALLMDFVPHFQLSELFGVAGAAACMVIDFFAFLVEACGDDVHDSKVSALDNLEKGLTRVLREDIVT